MVNHYVPIILKFLSMGFIACAGGLWSGADMESRPKHTDEQTLVSGTIWSQIIIPIGLLLTETMAERFHIFVHCYFYIMCIGIMLGAAVYLIFQEFVKYMKRSDLESERNHADPSIPEAIIQTQTYPPRRRQFDLTYLTIGVLFFFASITTTVNFIIVINNE